MQNLGESFEGDYFSKRHKHRRNHVASANVSNRHKLNKIQIRNTLAKESGIGISSTFLTALKPSGQENQSVNVISRPSSPKRSSSKGKNHTLEQPRSKNSSQSNLSAYNILSGRGSKQPIEELTLNSIFNLAKKETKTVQVRVKSLLKPQLSKPKS